MIISYPPKSIGKSVRLDGILREYFSTVSKVGVPHEHSTMGASKGKAKHDVVEAIYWAKP